MSQPLRHWSLQPQDPPPPWLVQAVQEKLPGCDGHYGAQVLWQRGLRIPKAVAGFLNPHDYRPTSPFAFGVEMERAVQRIQQAYDRAETVAIWGDFDADGVTATAVLWEGLGQYFPQQQRLFYYIPNRFTESHGLSIVGLDYLHQKGINLIITCDTGSTNLLEINYAQTLGMDVIVTDHHTVPRDRPPVTAIINPRWLDADHPFAHLSGVAVAYKLVEAIYKTMPTVPTQPLENLLDLVAIGLIADLVELKGEGRYLAQTGIAQLQKQANRETATRPGIHKLLELCNRTGDRPTDISFGLGPRINAVSRIQGDAQFCVELLTSTDAQLCLHLAESTELANSRRKAIQRDVVAQVRQRIAQLDLSTTRVIVLADEQWAIGVLGLVASQIASEYGRPTILLAIEGDTVRGSARSTDGIDLYALIHNHAHFLDRFGGHPYAAGLSLPKENLDLFTDAINQQLRQQGQEKILQTAIDLEITVAELGKELFQELKLIEPCGMGNSVPRLLIRNCQFHNIYNRKIKDWKGSKVEYIKTEFDLWDDTVSAGFPGVWWGHYRDEIPVGPCDVVIELDYNTFQHRYEIRVLDVGRLVEDVAIAAPPPQIAEIPAVDMQSSVEVSASPQEIWITLVGIAKYLSRTQTIATRSQIADRLGIGDRTLALGLQSLRPFGFVVIQPDELDVEMMAIAWNEREGAEERSANSTLLTQFCHAIREEQFRRQFQGNQNLTILDESNHAEQ